MPDIVQVCHRLEAWLTDNLPDAITSLRLGATDTEVAEYERATGNELPEDVRGWYRWRNGQERLPKVSILLGDEMLSLADSLKEWNRWQKVADMNE